MYRQGFDRALDSMAQTPIFPILGSAIGSIFKLEEKEPERCDALLGGIANSEETDVGDEESTSDVTEEAMPRAVRRELDEEGRGFEPGMSIDPTGSGEPFI